MKRQTPLTPNTEPDSHFSESEALRQATACALRLLVRREHSEREMRSKLEIRGTDAAVIETVLAQLVDEGYLSNARFAEVFVRSRYERGAGPLRIRAELRERGVDDVLVETAFRELAADWFEAARQQRYKRFGASLPQDFRERARQMRFLQQRGFSGEQTRAALDALP